MIILQKALKKQNSQWHFIQFHEACMCQYASICLTPVAQLATISTMIKSWRHKGLRKFYLSSDKSGIIAEHSRRLQVILQLLDAADSPEKLNLPGFSFHKLKGNLINFYSVTVKTNWRIIFQFDDQDAILVDYIDYH